MNIQMKNHTKSGMISMRVMESMHTHRTKQFIKRLNWKLPSDETELEKDQFDDGLSNYVIASHEGNHLGSFRLRSAVEGTMIEQCFTSNLPLTAAFIKENRDSTTEITRLVSSPILDSNERQRVCAALLEALRAEVNENPNTYFVAVVSNSILRLLFRRKIRFTLYERGLIDEGAAVSIILQNGLFSEAGITSAHSSP